MLVLLIATSSLLVPLGKCAWFANGVAANRKYSFSHRQPRLANVPPELAYYHGQKHSLPCRQLSCWQVYAASIMFGYFVRRVDKRFQLERSLGLLAEQQEDAVARLERLFSQADQLELVDDPDVASSSSSPPSSPGSGSSAPTPDAPPSPEPSGDAAPRMPAHHSLHSTTHVRTCA